MPPQGLAMDDQLTRTCICGFQVICTFQVICGCSLIFLTLSSSRATAANAHWWAPCTMARASTHDLPSNLKNGHMWHGPYPGIWPMDLTWRYQQSPPPMFSPLTGCIPIYARGVPQWSSEFPGRPSPPSPHHKASCQTAPVAGIHHCISSLSLLWWTWSQRVPWQLTPPPSLAQARAVASPSRWFNHILSSWWLQHARTSCKEGTGGVICEVPIVNIHPGRSWHLATFLPPI